MEIWYISWAAFLNHSIFGLFENYSVFRWLLQQLLLFFVVIIMNISNELYHCICNLYHWSIFPQTALELNGVLNSCRNGLCSIMICCSSWFRLGFRCLSPFSLLCFPGKGFCSIMMCWFLLVPARVPVLVSLSSLFFLFSGKGFVPSCPGSSWFRLGFRCLSSFFSLLSFLRKGVLFHHDLLVAPGSGSGSGGCLPSYLFFLFSGNGVVFHHDFLVPSGSGSGSGACLPSFFCQKRVLFHFNFLGSPRSGSGSGAYVPSSPFFSFSQENGFVPPRLHGFVSTQASCVPFSISSLTNEFRNEQWMKVSNNWNDQSIWIVHDLLGSMDWCCLGSMLV